MPFNGSGSFQPPGASFPAVPNTLIESMKFNAVVNDIATGLSNCVTRDGQSPATANLPMGGFRHTGVGSATARNHYATAGQIQDGGLDWVVAGGTADALTAIYVPTITALVDGQLCFVRAATSNATATPTFAPNGLSAHAVTKLGGSALVASEWTADQELILKYKLASTRWELMNPRKVANADVTGLGTASTQNTGTSGTNVPLLDGANTWSGIQTHSAAINEARGVDIASSTTTDIGAATGNYVNVTGTVTITGLGTVQAGTRRIVNFTGILTLTYNAASLILPTSANITTAAGDAATFISLGSGNWVCTNYQRKSGVALVSSVASTQLVKAWVNFNGTGTVAIRASYNVSSITDNGTGDYTINFTTPFSTANYAPVGMASDPSTNGSGYAVAIKGDTPPTASALRITTGVSNGAFIDVPYVSVAVFGDQ